MYKDFLFQDFIYLFKLFFTIPRSNRTLRDNYAWNEPKYAEFMMSILQRLEPRKFKNKECIIIEDEEVEEMYFIVEGEYSIGYTVNN